MLTQTQDSENNKEDVKLQENPTIDSKPTESFRTSETHFQDDQETEDTDVDFLQEPEYEILPYQKHIRASYESDVIQILVAALIFSNFIVASAKAQLTPDPGSPSDGIFEVFEILFAVVFTIELAYNMYGHWFCHFWQSGWNWFDFVIVIISLLALAFAGLPGIAILRLFRAFRVFRLFKRIPSLRAIIGGVFASLGGVANAFMVLGILMGIWSIMGVEFFGPYQSEEFGTFMRAMFTMWQVMSMDSWASQIARGVIYGEQMPFAAAYFISYLFVAGIIMANVVVAILLEKYLGAIEEINKEKEVEEQAKKKKKDEEAKRNEGLEKEAALEHPLPPKMGNMQTDGLKGLLLRVLAPAKLEDLEQLVLVSILETQACKESLFETVKLRRRSTIGGGELDLQRTEKQAAKLGKKKIDNLPAVSEPPRE